MSDEDSIQTKTVNALVHDAKPSAALFDRVTAGDITPVGRALDRAQFEWEMRLIRKLFGGLWVGGQMKLDRRALSFAPNELNARYNTGSLNFEIPLSTVQAVARRFGLFTGIIDIRHEGGTATVRCDGANAFAEQINRAVQSADAGVGSG